MLEIQKDLNAERARGLARNQTDLQATNPRIPPNQNNIIAPRRKQAEH